MREPSRILLALALVLGPSLAGSQAWAGLKDPQVLEAGGAKDASSQDADWAGGNSFSAPPRRVVSSGTPCLRFSLPFGALSDWRFFWDKEGSWDLSQDRRLILRMRASQDLGSCPVILYARSGEGWWRFPPISATRSWRDVVLDKSFAEAEGVPSGWGAISALRLAVLAGGEGEGSLEVASIAAQATLPEPWVWQVGGAKDSESAFSLILKGSRGPALKDVRKRLTQAEGILAQAHEGGIHGEGRAKALKAARARVEEAYALSQAPLKPGVRAVWIHNGDGPRAYGGERAARWKEAIPAMHALGINTLIPNLLWSGVAFYPSALVPNAPGVATEGDYLQEILDAAKPLGMRVILWKVMWQFAEGWLAQPGVSQPFREAGRLQLDDQGHELPWLCPCDERNRDYELKALVEAATRYPLDGIQLDYIRFEGPDAGFGPSCKARFEAWSKKTVERWPADCAPGGPLSADYADFKRELISSFVRDASKALRAARPGLELSAAVFPYPDQAYRSVSQDWPRWIKEGWLDCVYPMTYTEDAPSFAAATQAQAKRVGADRIVAGMRVSFERGRVAGPASVVDQLKAASGLGLKGVAFFEWREQIQDALLPYLRNGVWREGAYGLTFRKIPPSQLPLAVVPGEKPAGNPKVLLVDAFGDTSLVNALGGAWTAEADDNHLGTRLDGLPLRVSGEAGTSDRGLGLRGHFGANRAPWPYALLATAFNAERAPEDLGSYQHLVLKARGDNKALEVVLVRPEVKDYGNYRAALKPGPEWREYRLDLADFSQPAWAAPVEEGWNDVSSLEFRPGSRDDEDFWFEIGGVRFEP